MTHNSNPSSNELMLDQLWQAQSARKIDPEHIARQAKSQQFKQRLYITLDILSLLPLLFLFTLDLELTLFLTWFLAINCIAVFATVIYFVKLRWVAAFGQDDSTERYIQRLIKQYRNNAKIALVHKHSAWISWLALVVAFAFKYYSDGINADTQGLKLGAIFIGFSLFLAAWALWAHKRQGRFEKEAEDLIQLSE